MEKFGDLAVALVLSLAVLAALAYYLLLFVNAQRHLSCLCE